MSAENGLTEYSLGSRILRWDWGVLSNPEVAMTLKYADAVDPKAKIQPTAADLRAKYIENIKRLVAHQDKVAKFELLAGGKQEGEDRDAETNGTISELKLSNGLIEFNDELAHTVPISEDIRSRTDLWTGGHTFRLTMYIINSY